MENRLKGMRRENREIVYISSYLSRPRNASAVDYVSWCIVFVKESLDPDWMARRLR